MLRSLYIASTGMQAERTRMDIITNNITNVDTTGYKKDQMISRSFEDLLLERLNDPAVLRQEIGPLNTGTHIDEIATDFVEGSLEQTDEKTDLAITGEGFFRLQTPVGIRYTRSGNFTANMNGELVTQEGYFVLGQDGGRLRVGTGDFVVNENGNVVVDNKQVGTLSIVQFNDVSGLRKMGDNTYIHYNNEQPTAVQNSSVKQGYLEGSNVDIAREMVDMLMTNRVYESNQRIVKMVDESLGKTVNEIARF